jgi:hypothetical protein
VLVGAAAAGAVAVAAGKGVAVGSPPQAANSMEPAASMEIIVNRLFDIYAFLLVINRLVCFSFIEGYFLLQQYPSPPRELR